MGQQSLDPDKYYFVGKTCYDSTDSSCTGDSYPYYRNQCLVGAGILARGGFDSCYADDIECGGIDAIVYYISGPYDDYPSCAVNE